VSLFVIYTFFEDSSRYVPVKSFFVPVSVIANENAIWGGSYNDRVRKCGLDGSFSVDID